MHIVVHGGAGRVPDHPAPRATMVESAAQAGSAADSPVRAVCAAIGVLERSPRFNAGVGSAVQSDGRIRTDAGMMTDSGDIGAACAMPGVRDAIAVANAVRTNTPHVLLAGERAVDFAESVGIRTDHELFTEQTRDRWDDADIDDASMSAQRAFVSEQFGNGHDTVGAVATDGEHVVAGTSTGGRWFALAGRVGDVPQVGCGYVASPAGGVSATGSGEAIAQTRLSQRALAHLDAGKTAAAAATHAIETFDQQTESEAGLILLTPDGEVGQAFSSDAMQWCHARDGSIIHHAQTQYL